MRKIDSRDAIAYDHRVDGVSFKRIAYEFGMSESWARRAVYRHAGRKIDVGRVAKGQDPIFDDLTIVRT